MSPQPVDTIALLIAYLLGDGDLAAVTGGRIAGRHRYALAEGAAGGWALTDAALTLMLDGGDGAPDLLGWPDDSQERQRVAWVAWGPTAPDAARVAGWLAALVRRATRTPVALPDGRTALLYLVAPLEAPRSDIDPMTSMAMLRGVLRVHHQALA